jgi:EmrB/QacA subfamily drug resistance transporter
MYERRWFTLVTLCVALMVIGIDNTILNVALPSIVQDLHASGSQLQWIVDGYTVAFAGMLLTAGAVGDRLGRKRVLMIGLAVFGLMSALASQAESATVLVVFRGLMGIGGAFIFPTTLSILTNTFTDPKERAKAIGVWAGVSGVGIAVGPLAGGLLVEHFFWGSVFLVNLPVCLAAILMARSFVPDSRDTSEGGRLDPVGAVLSMVGLGALLFGIIEAPERGWGSAPALTGLGVGVAVLAAFMVWEHRSTHPMLDLRFFKNPRFSAASATITLTFFALYGSTFLLTQYFQFVLGYSPLKSGFLTAPVAVAIMVVSPQAPRLVERIGTKRVVVLGLTIVGSSLVLYTSDTLMSSLVGGILIRLLFGAGMGLTSAPATESIMGSLPKEKAGVGSAVNDTTRQTGGALGVAVIGSVFASRYHSVVATVSGVPDNVAAGLHNSVGQALDTARNAGLPQEQVDAVVEAARDAFVISMRVAFGMAAAIVAIAACVAWRWLPTRATLPPEEIVDGEPVPDERADLAEALSRGDA